MDDRELEALLTDIESDRAERKSSSSDKDRVAEAICAFANDLPNNRMPGVVFVGARDDGSCARLPITDRLLLELAAIRSEGNIQPMPSMVVQKRMVRGCELAVVVVHPSDAPPVRYYGQVWVRVGPRRAIASAEEERRLSEKRRARDLPFDIRSLPSASLDDLDLEFSFRDYLAKALSRDVLEQNQRSPVHQLTSLRLATAEHPPIPTVLGVLVTGKDPAGFIPGAYVQFLRIDGTELTDPIKDASDIGGPLAEALRTLDEKLHAHISVARDLTSQPFEVRSPEYPINALRQLLYNAVLHRTYEGTNAPVRVSWFSDRIEILSPGGPYGLVNLDNFGRPGIADYRNPHLAEAMKNLGYVQKFGVG
ncbi:MAG: RNA-binding domain-containing protein, partial [Acidobacteriota bacterium]